MITKQDIFEQWSWFALNKLGLVPSMSLNFYNNTVKGLKLQKDIRTNSFIWGNFKRKIGKRVFRTYH